VLQQRKLRGLGVRARAVAALLRVFSLRVLALVSPSFQVSFSFLHPLNQQPGKSSLRVPATQLLMAGIGSGHGAVVWWFI